MKQSDIMTAVMIATIGTVAAFALVNTVLGNPDDLVVEYKSVSSISSVLTDPDPEVFNYSSINPTVEIWIGNCKDIDRDGYINEEEQEKCNNDKNDPTPEPDPMPEPEPTPEPTPVGE